MKSNEAFDKWWDENEQTFMEQSYHMSEYHMAHLVWDACVNTVLNGESAANLNATNS